MNSEVVATIRGLLEAAIAGTESTIRTRDYHGLRAFAITEEEWLSRYRAALTALEEAVGWEMLPDGTEYIDGGDNYLTASLGGSLLSIIRSDLDEPDMDEECDTHSIQLDPNKFRLFRKRQPAQEPDD